MKKKKAFTLIELIAVLVILAILALIVTPLVLNIIRKARISADKRSIDAYGRSIEYAIANYLLDKGTFPTSIEQLTIEYSGNKVLCETTQLNPDTTVYLENCTVAGREVDYIYGKDKLFAASQLIKKANKIDVTNYEDGSKGEMYTFEHDATIQTPALTDYRYIGSNPNNYVTFNNETWRIIGVFTTDDENGKQEQRIKLIRNEKLSTDMAWDLNNANEWQAASLNTYLNTDYYNSLTDTAKNMIDSVKYYLGGRNWDNANGTHLGTASDMYTWERGTTVYSGRSTNWIGLIGLMYPSDYAYTYAYEVDNKCYTDPGYCDKGTPTAGWIYNTNSNSHQWTIAPRSVFSSVAFIVSDSGYFEENYIVSNPYGVRPVLYLKSNIQIDSGDGTEGSPYVFKL